MTGAPEATARFASRAAKASPRHTAYRVRVIFKAVGDSRPYPDHGKDAVRDWADVPPRMVRLEELITTKRTLDLGQLLAEDSTFYGDLFAHVVEWQGNLYLEDGLHRALRAALQQRPTLHARVLVLD
jgi:Arc/MetJ family transcription regulator